MKSVSTLLWRLSASLTVLVLLTFPSSANAQNGITKLPDLNGDGLADLLWHNPTNGQTEAWLMNATSAMSSTILLEDPVWKVIKAADLDGDGKTDLILNNETTGQTVAWIMNGATVASWTLLLEDPSWKITDTADLNGDGKADLLLYNSSTGRTAAWLMNGATATFGKVLLTDADWRVVATADLNGDHRADLIWRNASTGQTAAWLMIGTNPVTSTLLLTDSNWKVIAAADFNGDRTADLLWYNASSGVTAMWLMNGTSTFSAAVLATDPNWKVAAIADLNGDGMADIVFKNTTTGQKSAWLMNGTRVSSSASLLTSLDWSLAAADDLNRDGKADLLWFNSSTGQTAAWMMSGTVPTSGANLLTDANARLNCIKGTSVVIEVACDDSVASAATGTVPLNQPPSVDAGVDQSITLPAIANLAGNFIDDGAPIELRVSTWSQLNGPASSVTFDNASSPTTTAIFSAAGTYTLRLTASDGELSTSDDVVIVVNPTTPLNQAPLVNAGSDFTITLPGGITLEGNVTDDGLPAGYTLTRSWSKVSGPGIVTFTNPTALNSTANFSMAGTYTLRLTATDGLLSRSDDVVFVVNAPLPVNLAPAVSAGPDQSITFPGAATLAGTTTDDGLPSGTLTSTWSKISGPGTVTFSNSTSLSPTATFSQTGTYTLRLSANDSLISAVDDVIITSNSSGAPQAYYVDQTLGSDSNNGSQGAPWKNAPGMTACTSTCASTTITPGSTIYLDRADTWLISGQYGIHVRGGVSYIGDEWGTGSGKAIIRASSSLATAVIDFREDHPAIPTIVKGFEVDANGMVTNGVGFNMPFYTGPLIGATKRVENLNVHHTWSRTSQGQYTYGIVISNHGGTQATVKNVEILNSVVHDTSRDGIVLYPGDENADCIIQNILIRGNEVYNTGQDPDYGGGSGIVVKGRVIDAVIENNYVHDILKANLIFINGNESNHFGFGPANIHIRYNALNASNMGQSAILVYDGSSGKDPKDLKIYGNLVYASVYNSSKLGGLWLDSGLGSTNSLLVYNNTFYNAPVTVNNSAATFPTFEFKNNIVYQTSGTAITGSSRFTAASNNLTTNPSFKNVSNLPTGFIGTPGLDLAPNTDGLSINSLGAAIDAGTALGTAYNLSINGLTRAQGNAWDIGAYESLAGAPPPPSDTTPPTVSGGFPIGALPAGTTVATMGVTTNENATCRYSTTAGTPYLSMTTAFSISGGTTHSITVSSLINGTTYNRYVRCTDSTGNADTTDYVVTFAINSATQSGGGTTVTATSCSLANVQAAISAVTPGGTVVVPAGTCSWSGGLSISGIQLVGAGKSTSGTVITSGMVSMNKHSTQTTRVSGFRFTGADEHVRAGGNPSSKPYIIDNNYFFTGDGRMLGLTVNGGLLHHNDFTATTPTGADVLSITTSENWSQAATFGTEDSTGERNIYFEDNTFTNILETAPDGDRGARLVIRHNTFRDSSIVFHGGSPSDSSPQGGIRQFEIYDNIFDRVSNAAPLNKWIWVRGGTGVIANNSMERAESPDDSSYPNKVEVRLSLACPNAYPVQYQVGQSNQTPESVPSHPLLIFGNSGSGPADGNFIRVVSSDTAGGSCSSPSNYIKPGRDYVLSNSWGWTPYAYPHPLQNATSTQ